MFFDVTNPMKVSGSEPRDEQEPLGTWEEREERSQLSPRTDSGGADPEHGLPGAGDANRGRDPGRKRAGRGASAHGTQPPRRRRRREEREKEDLGGEQSPWKDRAVRHRQRWGDATDSSAEQGLEVGHSETALAGAPHRKRTAHRRVESSPAPRDTSVELKGVRSEQPASGSEPSHGSGLASAERACADLRIRTHPGSARSRGRSLLRQGETA